MAAASSGLQSTGIEDERETNSHTVAQHVPETYMLALNLRNRAQLLCVHAMNYEAFSTLLTCSRIRTWAVCSFPWMPFVAAFAVALRLLRTDAIATHATHVDFTIL